MNKNWVSWVIRDQDDNSAHCTFVSLAKMYDFH